MFWTDCQGSTVHCLNHESLLRITDAHKAGEGYAKLSLCFQVSLSGVGRMIKKFKEPQSGEDA